MNRPAQYASTVCQYYGGNSTGQPRQANSGQVTVSLSPSKCRLEKPCRIFRRYRRGAAAVEFALVAPLFFAMIFGIVEAGRMLHVQQIMTNATREGARRAMLSGATNGHVKQIVRETLANSGISVTEEKVKVNPPDLTVTTNGTPITVSVEIPFSQVTWLPSPMFSWGTNRTMRAFTVMRRDTP